MKVLKFNALYHWYLILKGNKSQGVIEMAKWMISRT